jgi:hypothetical protein
MRSRVNQFCSTCVSAVIIGCLVGASAAAQTAREVCGAAPVVPLTNEPPAKIVIDPPLAEPLSQGRVVIQYRTENLHLVPVSGAAALAVSPRIGHIHVRVDNAPGPDPTGKCQPSTDRSGYGPGLHTCRDAVTRGTRPTWPMGAHPDRPVPAFKEYAPHGFYAGAARDRSGIRSRSNLPVFPQSGRR